MENLPKPLYVILYTGSETLIGTYSLYTTNIFHNVVDKFKLEDVLQIIRPDEEKLEIHLTIPTFVLATQKDSYTFYFNNLILIEEPTDELVAAYKEVIEKKKKEPE